MILHRSSRIGPCLALGCPLALVLLLAVDPRAFGQTAAGESSPSTVQQTAPLPLGTTSPLESPKPDADALQQSDRQLDETRAKERESAETQAQLKREIDKLGEDRSALNQQLIDTAGRVRAVEARIEETRTGLVPLEDRERLLRKSLAERRTAIVEVLAVLQRASLEPPPALIVHPEDALQAVRTAIALGAMLPEMRAQAEELAGDLVDLARARNDVIGERERLSRDLNLLGHEQLRLNLLIEERQKKQAAAEQALDAERQRAADLARQAESLKELIGRLESALDAAARAARAEPRSIEEEANQPSLAALQDPGRLAPAVAFAAMRGHLRLPVNGVKIGEFGSPDGLGGTQKGLSIAAHAGAQITSPCDGWVVYAGAFRSYGELLILNAGGGYHVVLAGMERISVDLGQFVLTGEPVAIMGGGSQVSAAGTAKSKQPVLYVEFRKDGAPIDPSPWWATTEGEKARG
jgi:septal ring factor EnvC (AmiA/AmiB activator)